MVAGDSLNWRSAGLGGVARVVLLLAVLWCGFPPEHGRAQEQIPRQKVILGRVENAVIHPGDLEFRAKLDSGAQTTSIHATHLQRFNRDGESWVRFRLTDKRGRSVTLEKKVVRESRIKNRKGGATARPVVLLDICLGGVRQTVEVNLANRSRFNYPLLIGRNFLSGSILIDSELTFTTKPTCPSQP